MKDLELILDTNKIINFSLGDNPGFLMDFEEPDEIDIDTELKRSYWLYRKHGLEFLFKENKLSTIYMYKKFAGTFSFLPESFFKNFNKNEFISHLSSLGFSEHEKKYPFSIDMLNDKYRIRYYERPDNHCIILDDGNKIRKSGCA